MMDPILVTIDRIVKETNDTYSYYLSSCNGTFPDYKAGQFITVIIHLGEKEIRRSYSLGSTPGVDAKPFITIKRVENGAVSRYLLSHLKEGDELKILPPAGRFTIENAAAGNYFFIAAGSGITPIFSLIKQLLYTKNSNNQITLLYQNTHEASSIYRGAITELHERFKGRFELIELFSRPIEDHHFPRRLNNYLLEKIIKEEKVSEVTRFYLCGPPTFMRMADFTLRVNGVDDSEIKKEHFVVGFVPKSPLITDRTPKEVVVHYKGEKHTLNVAYPQSILEVALVNGIQLPYSCRGGRCSVCSAKCLQGKVIMSINEVLTEKDIEQGLVLTCVGFPETNAELVI